MKMTSNSLLGQVSGLFAVVLISEYLREVSFLTESYAEAFFKEQNMGLKWETPPLKETVSIFFIF